jgi:hypothetical protein
MSLLSRIWRGAAACLAFSTQVALAQPPDPPLSSHQNIRRIAWQCRRAPPAPPSEEARLLADGVLLEMHGVRLFRAIPAGTDARLRPLLGEITRAQFSGIAACLRREGLDRLPVIDRAGPLYRLQGTWRPTGPPVRLITYFVIQNDIIGPFDIFTHALFWDRREQRRVMFAALFRPERRAAVKALICAKLRDHPSPLGRTAPCPELDGFNATTFATHCLQPDRLSQLELWVSVAGPPGEPERGGNLAIRLFSAEILDALDPAYADSFAAEDPRLCPPVI